jgi:alkylation response protein AidB-like acyl-CoA dehydrogenase
MGVILAVHTSVGTNPIVYYGTEEQKMRFVPDLATGRKIGAFCLTETGAGSDAAGLRTRAVRDGDVYVLNGAKMFITNGGEADVYIVFAKTDAEARSRGISAFIVERDNPGLIIGKNERKMGLHGSRTVALTFENMRVPADCRLGEEGEGFRIAMRNLDVGRLGIAAQALGIAEAALECAVRYARREPAGGGDPLLKRSQAAAFRLADMATQVEAARHLVYSGAQLLAEGAPCGKEASMAKLFASRTAVEVSGAALDLVGKDAVYVTHGNVTMRTPAPTQPLQPDQELASLSRQQAAQAHAEAAAASANAEAINLGVDAENMNAETAAQLEDTRNDVIEAATGRSVTDANVSLDDVVSDITALERYFRDAKITEIYEGTSEIQRIVIAKNLWKD